jgi:hypothetical protein
MASHKNRMMKRLHFFRSVSKLRCSAPFIEEDQSAPARLQASTTTEAWRRSQLSRSCRTMGSYNISSRSIPTPVEADVGGRGDACDDCTVVSNASTVKAGSRTPSRRRLQYETNRSSSCDKSRGMIRSCRAIMTTSTTPTTPPRRHGVEKVQGTTSLLLTPSSTVHSDDGNSESPKRKGTLLFWKNGISLRNDKLSQAAMQLAQEEPIISVVKPRCSDSQEGGSTVSRSKPMLSLPMKRFLVESLNEVGSSTSRAEF